MFNAIFIIMVTGTIFCLSTAGQTGLQWEFCIDRSYMIFPKLVHHHTLKQIGCYLKTTSFEGLIMKPSEKLLKIISYPDINFPGLYRYKAVDDPVCVERRTGYVTLVVNCPIIWKPKLPSETALSTFEYEIILSVASCFLSWIESVSWVKP